MVTQTFMIGNSNGGQLMASTSDIPKISVADATLDDWTLPEEVITGGNPVAR
ncbi:uncharacterized protein METZ01_LOCUS502695, partial [marine metagenome]